MRRRPALTHRGVMFPDRSFRRNLARLRGGQLVTSRWVNALYARIRGFAVTVTHVREYRVWAIARPR